MTEMQHAALSARQRGHRAHICCACDFPIAVYGRCAPCLHVYCIACAATMARCLVCGALITKLERIPTGAGQVFVSPITLQGHRSEADLARYTQLYAPRLLAWAQSVGVPPSPPTHQQQQQQQLPPPAPAQARPPPPGPQQAAQHAEMAEARRQHALMLQRQQMLLVQQQHGLEPLPLQQQLALLGQQQQQGRRG